MVFSNKIRAFILGLTSAYGVAGPKSDLKRYYQHFSRFSAAFSWLSEIAMITLGSELKRNEPLSARLGDMLSLVYMGASVIYHYEQQKDKQALVVAEWVCQDIIFRLQTAMDEFLLNFPFRCLARVMRWVVFPLGRRFHPPKDNLTRKVAGIFMEPSKTRDQLTDLLYKGKLPSKNPISLLQQALVASIKTERLLKRLFKAEKKDLVSGMTFELKVSSAVKNSILTSEEGKSINSGQCLMYDGNSSG